MRRLADIVAILPLVACASTVAAEPNASAEYVCRPPMTIAGHEPRLCWHDSDHAMWCVYSDVGRCDGTWVRESCDAEWAPAWAECQLPSLSVPLGGA